jgi:virginiamycin B lyase
MKKLCRCLTATIVTLTCSTAAHPYEITEFPLPQPSRVPNYLTSGPDGAIWFTEGSPSNYAIGRISPSGSITEFAVPGDTEPYGIALGPDGNLWFTEYITSGIARMTTTGSITSFPIPTDDCPPYGCFPIGITAGPDGNMWFVENVPFDGRIIGRITLDGTITEFSDPFDGHPISIVAGPDGNLWIADTSTSDVVRITTSGAQSSFPNSDPSAGTLYNITAGPDGNLWFTQDYANRIGRVTTGGTVTNFVLPNAGSRPLGITAGSDGALWFTEFEGSRIGRITTDGAISEIQLPYDRQPAFIASGADGNIWYSDYAGLIGRVALGPVCGDGATSSPEQCDDGNLTSGDGCDENCTITACGNGILTSLEECDDGNGVSNDGCSDGCTFDCSQQLRTDCRTADVSTLVVKDSEESSRDSLRWKWSRGESTAAAELTDPTGTGRFNICLYRDASVVTGELFLPSGAAWTSGGEDGFRYSDRDSIVGGVSLLDLRTGIAGKARIVLKARGEHLPDALLPATSYAIQLVDNAADICWGSAFTNGSIKPGSFKSKSLN